MLKNHFGEKRKIDNVINQFFSLFNNKNQSIPDLDAICNLCIPGAIIIRKAGPDQVIDTLESFISPRKIILSDGTITDFEEFEIKEETVVIKNIAHRYSRYQKNGIMHGNPFTVLGNKFFHLIKTGENWEIVSLIWEDDE